MRGSWIVTLCLGLGVSACSAAPLQPVQELATTDIPPIEALGGQVGTFRADDGVSLRYAHFPARGALVRGNAILVTGRTQFIEVYLEQIANLRERGFAVWAMDWRGQGLSGGHPSDDPHKGHVGTFTRYLRDLHQFRHKVVQGEGKWLLVSQSMGGGLSVRYAIEHPGDFDAVVVGAPLIDLASGRGLVGFVAWRGKSAPLDYVAGEGGGYGQHLRTFEDNPFSRDRRRFLRQHAYIDRTPALALGAPTQGWIRAALVHVQRFDDPAFTARLQTPTLIVSAETDSLVSIDAQARIARQSKRIERVTLPGTLHEIWLAGDAAQKQLWAAVDGFLARVLPMPEPPAPAAAPTPADAPAPAAAPPATKRKNAPWSSQP